MEDKNEDGEENGPNKQAAVGPPLLPLQSPVEDKNEDGEENGPNKQAAVGPPLSPLQPPVGLGKAEQQPYLVDDALPGKRIHVLPIGNTLELLLLHVYSRLQAREAQFTGMKE